MACLAVAPAHADMAQARAQLHAGNYASAIDISTAQQSADGYILAAEAMSAQVMLELVPNVNASARAAKNLAGKALEIDPDNSEALIQYALALGFETRSSGLMKAYFGKLPQKSKAAIDKAYAAAPDDARTSALIGAWHLGILRKTGEERARKMFGANLTDGMTYYNAAVAKAPNDIVIAGNYAITLLSIDPVANRDRVETLLMSIKNTPPKHAVEAEVQRRMVPLIKFLDDPAAMKTATESLMNDPEE